MTELTCRQCLELLVDYVSRDMSPDDLAKLDEHFRCCPPCLVYLNTYEVTIRVTRKLPRESPLPPEFEQRLLAAMREIRPGGCQSDASAARPHGEA